MKIRTFAAIAVLAAGSAIDIQTASAQAPAEPHAVDTVAPGEFPAAGHSYAVDFGKQKFRLEFNSETELTFTSPDGKNTQTVPIMVTRIRPNVFMVYWSRKAGQYVVHVEDFENRVAYSNIFLPDGSVQRMKGTLVPLD
jgi:hypothetical protein